MRVLPGTIPYHLGSSRELGMSQGNIISWKRIIGQPVTRFISGKRCFSHYKKRFFPIQRYPRRRPCPPSPVRDRKERTRRRGATEIIFHVGRCEINNGQTRFDFPEVPVGPATHYARRGKARERDLLAAECYEQTSTKGSRWLIIALTAAVTTMTRSGDDFSRWSESAINTPGSSKTGGSVRYCLAKARRGANWVKSGAYI
ncbi:hypothetical protein ACS0PU_007064 [Formica fusca]